MSYQNGVLLQTELLLRCYRYYSYVAHEILSALEYLHSLPCPIIHRDVKVSNVLIRMSCDCRNPLICVCRRRSEIVLSDFDASLELCSNGTLEPDAPRTSSFGFQDTSKVSCFDSFYSTKSPATLLFFSGLLSRFTTCQQ